MNSQAFKIDQPDCEFLMTTNMSFNGAPDIANNVLMDDQFIPGFGSQD